MIYARFLYIFSKIVGGLFRKLCFFSCLKLPIIKIQVDTAGLLPAYETPTAHIRDDRSPKIVFFVPQKFPIIKIRVLCSLHQIVAVNQPLSSHSRDTTIYGIEGNGCR